VVGSGNWTPGSPISVNGIQISLSGAPRANDQFDVAPTRNWASSNGNALAMVGLGSQAVVDGANLADAYAGLLSDVGVRVQSANSAAEVSGSVASQAKATLSSQTGVNLDEEAAKLIQYQQAYQAAAKILQVAQKIFDTVLGMTNG
jgi:flagellar hook-associated protein 1 FlgK